MGDCKLSVTGCLTHVRSSGWNVRSASRLRDPHPRRSVGGSHMSQASRDTQLAVQAVKIILDGRDPVKDRSTALITLDHTIALMMLVAMEKDPRKAVQMFNEGT